MGLKVRASIVFVVLISHVALLSCSDSTKPEQEDPYKPAEHTTIIEPEESTIILDYSPEGSITLDPASALADSIQIGEILIGQNDEVAPNGFLRKVTSISRERDGLVLGTEPARLMEAFESLHFSETLQLRPSDIRSHDLREGVTLLNDPEDEWLILGLNLILYDHDDDLGTTNDQIRLAGVDSFRVEIPVAADGDLLDLHRFEISLKTETRVHLQLVAAIEGVTIEESYPIGQPIRFARIPIPGVPIWITPTLTAAIHINGDLSVSLDTSLSYTEEVTNGIGWNEDEGSYAIHDDYQSFTFSPPELSGELDLEVGPSLRFSCLIYDVVGPYIEGRMGLNFLAEIGDDPCDTSEALSLRALLYAVAGIEIDCYLLDIDLDLEPYVLYSFPVGNWESSAESFRVATQDGVVCVSQNGSISMYYEQDTPHYGVEVRNGTTYIWDDGVIKAFSKEGVQTGTTIVPGGLTCNNFVVIGGGRFALLRNMADEVIFIRDSELIQTVKILDEPDSHAQNLDGVVVGDRLIISEDGYNHVLSIDLQSYELSLFKDLSGWPGWIGAIEYSNGSYYIATFDEVILVFQEGGDVEPLVTLPEENLTGIVVFNNYAFVTVNFADMIYKVNIQTGSYDTFATGLNYPTDIELIQ